MKSTDSKIIAWTDGSAFPNPGGEGGIGVLLKLFENGKVTRRKEISKYIGGKCTNNIAELTAIQEALISIKWKHVSVIIRTDSTYCIGVLTGKYRAHKNTKLVGDIKKLLKAFKHLKFEYVKGHNGNWENERVDTLANKGRNGRIRELKKRNKRIRKKASGVGKPS